MKKKLVESQERAEGMIRISGHLDMHNSKKKLKNLKKVLLKLKKEFLEELGFIKAQTVTKKNGNKVMAEAKKRLLILKEKIEDIVPAIQEYEVELKKVRMSSQYR